MTRIARLAAAMSFAAIAIVAATGDAGAQARGVPNAMQGFVQNRDQPVQIEAASLEVRDKDKVATFSGDVHVVQGDTDMRCKVLVVFYEEEGKKPGMLAAQPGPGGQQQIRRMEAKGGVVVTQKDQTATGDNGEFDMRSNTVTLTGSVTVSRSQDVMRGQKLVVDLTSGVSRMDGGRVEGLFNQTPRPEAHGPAPPRPARTN
jgi:lipopolysaccharide export system protein LptA